MEQRGAFYPSNGAGETKLNNTYPMKAAKVPGPLPVTEQLRDDVLALVRAGAKDTPETLRCAVKHFARFRGLRIRQASQQFAQYAY